MAGTNTITYQEHRGPVKRIIFTWTSDASGDVNGTLTKIVSGIIQRIVTNPDGTDVPTNLYDGTLEDADGLDVAETLLANRSSANSEEVLPLLNTQGVAFDGTLELKISAAGNAKKGVVTVYYS